MLYRDFVLLLLFYIVRSYIIVVLRVHGCACAGVRTRNKRRLECSCSMLALFHNFALVFLSYNKKPQSRELSDYEINERVNQLLSGDRMRKFI